MVERKLAELEHHKESVQERHHGLGDTVKAIQKKVVELQAEEHGLHERRNEVNTLAKKESEKRARLERIRESNNPEAEFHIRKEIWAAMQKVTTISLSVTKVAADVAHAEIEDRAAAIAHDLAADQLEELTRELQRSKEGFSSMEKEKQVLEQRFADIVDRRQAVQRKLGRKEPTEAEKVAFARFPDDLDQLAIKIEELQLQASQIGALSTDAVRFAALEKELAVLERKLSDLTSNEGSLQGELDQKKREWEEQVGALVNRMDIRLAASLQTFNVRGTLRLGCAGEPQDYSMEILVAFREKEEPRPLHGSQHSGGERAVATMLYILAMQAVTPCPFRVVDEINQGMDRHNERLIFKQLMETCGKQVRDAFGLQYFVISPKLLPSLSLTDCVRVHTIFSSRYLMRISASMILRMKAKQSQKRAMDGGPAGAGGGGSGAAAGTHGEGEEDGAVQGRRQRLRTSDTV